MAKKEFTLTDLADEIRDASFVEWFAAEGDAVREGDDLCEIVTDKASLVLSAPCDGTVTGRRAAKGDKLDPAGVLLEMDCHD